MEIQARAKINWTLNVTGQRPDGYHLLDMLMQPIALCDTLRMETAQGLSLTVEGANGLSAGEDNLVLRAAKALQSAGGISLGAKMTLTKRIPMGAGLGGGSADAAAALLALNSLWGLALPIERLEELALPIGADIPFCLHTEAMRVRGIGEKLTPLPPLPLRNLVILKGAEGLDTGSVYRAYDHAPSERAYDHLSALSALASPSGSLGDALFNVLEPPARALCPRIGDDIARLYAAGASFAMMTGSGSAVFGVFDDETAARKARKELEKEDANGVCILTHTI